jgi:hypothetical protein
MKRARKNKGGKNTIARSRLLENAISGLRHLDFYSFKSIKEFQKAGLLIPERYLIRHYPHPTLYHTPGLYETTGWKEAFICDRGTQYIFEAKYQCKDGTTDEKLPHVFESFLASPVRNWIVWFDGKFWLERPRALGGIAWLRQHAATRCPMGRNFYICATDDEWVALVDALFKRSLAA